MQHERACLKAQKLKQETGFIFVLNLFPCYIWKASVAFLNSVNQIDAMHRKPCAIAWLQDKSSHVHVKSYVAKSIQKILRLV